MVRRQAGFTLLEILVVLAMMALVYAMVPAMISGKGSTTEMRAAARHVAAGLRKARSEAVAGHQESTLTVDVDKHLFRISGDKREYALPESAEISVYTAQAEVVQDKVASIRFYPDGSSTGGAVGLTRGDTKFRVDIDWLTGSVTILD